MPLPPLPKAMGSILKESEMTVKAASNPKSLKTEVKEKPVISETNRAVKRVKSPKAADLLEKKESLPKKQKGYRAKTHGKSFLCSIQTCSCMIRSRFFSLRNMMYFCR